MADYIILMHDDAIADEAAWGPYLRRLQSEGRFEGGSAIGTGVSLRKDGQPGAMSRHLAGFIRITADSLDQAKAMLDGNPVFEAGGTIEIRELPKAD